MQIICISGRAQHGKDTLAGFLKNEIEKDGSSVLITHYGDLLKYICRMFFNWDGKKDENGRSLLQYIGTDVVRAKDQSFWTDFIVKILTVFNGEWDYVIIPDCRFPNEVYDLVAKGLDVTHIRIVRSNFDDPLTPEQRMHPSETAMDRVRPDYLIKNDGSLGDLRKKALEWLEKTSNGLQITFDNMRKYNVTF